MQTQIWQAEKVVPRRYLGRVSRNLIERFLKYLSCQCSSTTGNSSKSIPSYAADGS